MLKPLSLFAALVVIAGAGPASTPRHTAIAAESRSIDEQAVTPALLAEIAAWLSQHFDLPAAERPPKVAFVTPGEITAVRYRGFLGNNNGASPYDANDTVAVYEAASETIYLPEGWRGSKPADMSVLVHEMAHHLQHQADLKFACPAEREHLAYAAQQRWLQRSGRSLAQEFGIDGFTLLVRTNCGF